MQFTKRLPIKIDQFDWYDYESTEFLAENSLGNLASVWTVDLNNDKKSELILSIASPPREIPVSQAFHYDEDNIIPWFGFWGDEDTPLYYSEGNLIYDTISNHGGSYVITTVKTDLKSGTSYVLSARQEQYDGQTIPTKYILFPPKTVCTRDLLDGIYDNCSPETVLEKDYNATIGRAKESMMLLKTLFVICEYDINDGFYPIYSTNTKKEELNKEIANTILENWDKK